MTQGEWQMSNALGPVVGRFVPRSDTQGAGVGTNPTRNTRVACGLLLRTPLAASSLPRALDSVFIFIVIGIETSV